MKKVKRNIIIAAVLLFVCAAVYLNWSYNNSWGAADPAMVKMCIRDRAYGKAGDGVAEHGDDGAEGDYGEVARPEAGLWRHVISSRGRVFWSGTWARR